MKPERVILSENQELIMMWCHLCGYTAQWTTLTLVVGCHA